jgi:hypothetical protein
LPWLPLLLLPLLLLVEGMQVLRLCLLLLHAAGAGHQLGALVTPGTRCKMLF